MSDPLSAAASVVGLIGLVNEVTKLLASYISGVRSAHKDASQLHNELTALCFVLEQIRDLLVEEQDKGTAFNHTSVLVSVLGLATSHVSDLFKKLNKINNPTGNKIFNFFQRLTWPLTLGDCEKSVTALRNLVQTFQFSLTVSNCSLLSESYTEVRKSVEKNHETLQVTMSTLENMSLPMPEKLVTESAELSNIMGVLSEVADLAPMIQNMSVGVSRLEQKLNDGELKELMDWLSPIEPHQRHFDVSSQRVKDTGNWFIETEEFQKWKNSDDSHPDGKASNQVFLCAGKPGAGKTVMCSHVIDHLQENVQGKGTSVSYIYFDYRDDRSSWDFTSVVNSIFKQIILSHPDECSAIIPELSALKQKWSNVPGCRSAGSIFTNAALVKCLQLFNKSYICFDALDECPEQSLWWLLAELKMLFNNPALKNSLRMFVTGRPHVVDDIKRTFQDGALSTTILEARKEDILKFINYRIQMDNSGLHMSAKFTDEIISKIVEAADGMFLLPAMQIDHVLEKMTIRARREALNTLPRGLNNAFLATISRIKNQSESKKQLGLDTLKWVFLAERQLTLYELVIALSIKPGDIECDKDGFPSTKALLDCSLGLVILDESTKSLRLVHKSLQEFFEKHHETVLPRGHAYLASTCLTYMSFEYDRHQLNALTKYGMLQYYAIRSWGNHAKICEEYFFDQETCRAISSTFRDRKSIAYGYWPMYTSDYDYINMYRESMSDNDLFHIPVWFDLTPLIKYIIENWNIDINRDRKSLTALMVAVCRGSTATVQLLLEKSAKTDLVCMIKQETALAMAVDRNYEEKVRLLLEHHADIEAKNENGYTPLIIATLHGNETIVRMLLDRGADIEAKDLKGRTPLQWAADKDHAAIVRLLLEKGANVLSRDKVGLTPARLMGKALGERIVADENHPLGILLKQMYSASPTS